MHMARLVWLAFVFCSIPLYVHRQAGLLVAYILVASLILPSGTPVSTAALPGWYSETDSRRSRKTVLHSIFSPLANLTVQIVSRTGSTGSFVPGMHISLLPRESTIT